jgi:hypothetical protein
VRFHAACCVHRVAPKVVGKFTRANHPRYCRARVNMERERPTSLRITGNGERTFS